MGKLKKNILDRYKKIIDEYFNNGFVKCDAYRKYYPSVKANQTATLSFNRMQKNVEVAEYIKKKHEKTADKIEVTHEQVLRDLKAWIELDITETIGLTQAEIKLLPFDLKRFISSHKTRTKNYYDREGNLVSTEVITELRFMNKEKAYDMINRHIGFYEADNNQRKIVLDLSTSPTNELIERAKAIRKLTDEQS